MITTDDTMMNMLYIRGIRSTWQYHAMITYRLDKGTKVNCVNHKHHFPLHKATENGQLEVMKDISHTPIIYQHSRLFCLFTNSHA